jgi:phosphoribosylamine---glycine ligase
MILGIIGSGGREHAICQSVSKSKTVKKIYCFPGNAGTSLIAENVALNLEKFDDIKNFILEKKIDLIIVGPEKPLVAGIVDFFEQNNIKVFGPNKIASQLEGSKIFTKELCKKYKIPTAKFGIFETSQRANIFLKDSKYPIVVKADGLAAGKGVYICENQLQAMNAVKEIFDGKFGVADKILIEEFLDGEEMSYFIISDGRNLKKFETAQDHKRVFEGDKGKNTGGMGAYSPSLLINQKLDEKILEKIIKPTIKGLKDMGSEYKGFLYAGLMIINNEPYLIEYNVRMGDPECQTILPKLKTDFAELLLASVNYGLSSIDLEWYDYKSLCVVLCSKGYPDKFKNNLKIENLENLNANKNEFIFHAGTKMFENRIYSNGGRVLNFVVLSNDFKQSRNRALELIKTLNWLNGFCRNDIGFKAIN